MEEPLAYRKVEAVAADGSKNFGMSVEYIGAGPGDLIERAEPKDSDRLLSSLPVDMAARDQRYASQLQSRQQMALQAEVPEMGAG